MHVCAFQTTVSDVVIVIRAQQGEQNRGAVLISVLLLAHLFRLPVAQQYSVACLRVFDLSEYPSGFLVMMFVRGDFV